jgi:antitoxin (DNA-binding transcriptional repressor) of toxin-antitoxin stability system
MGSWGEAKAASKFDSLMARVRAGAEVVIENDARPVAILRSAAPVRRTISESIALLLENSTATIDPVFARDVKAAIESHRVRSVRLGLILDSSVATADLRHFQIIPGLTVVQF